MATTTAPSGSARSATEPGRLFIAGQWRDAQGGARMDVIAPATGEKLTDVARATTADVDAAVAAARAAFDSGEWSGLTARERGRILRNAHDLMRERTEELAQAESQDVGKPIALARAVDVNNAAETFEYFATSGQQVDGALRETPGNTHAYVRREPVGVVAAITPFNFPLILSSSKIAPALIAGNTIVHKPSSDTPLSALLMAEILRDAGVPDGVYNVVTGSGGDLGDHLVSHPGVNKVAFTGSTEVGAHVAELAGKHLRPVTAELGGNAANILFADANLDQAIGAIIQAFVFNTGQFCMAGPRLLVERALYDQVLAILADAVAGVPMGDITDPDTVIGPLASSAQREKVSQLVDASVAAGGRVVTGGAAAVGPGFYYQPTVVADIANDNPAVVNEVFGPVLTVQPFDSEEEAVALANSVPQGLAAGIQTTNLGRAHRVAAQLEAGIVWVNGWALMDPSMPFGGVKVSGWGRENGPEGLAAYLRAKSVVINLDE